MQFRSKFFCKSLFGRRTKNSFGLDILDRFRLELQEISDLIDHLSWKSRNRILPFRFSVVMEMEGPCSL